MAVTIEDGLVAFLLEDPEIAAMVQNRIGPWSAQSDALPRVTYHIISGNEEMDLTRNTDQPAVRIQIDCWASTMAGAKSLAYKVRNSRGGESSPAPRLKEMQGDMGGVIVQATVMENRADESLPPIDAGANSYPRRTMDFTFAYLEQ